MTVWLQPGRESDIVTTTTPPQRLHKKSFCAAFGDDGTSPSLEIDRNWICVKFIWLKSNPNWKLIVFVLTILSRNYLYIVMAFMTTDGSSVDHSLYIDVFPILAKKNKPVSRFRDVSIVVYILMILLYRALTGLFSTFKHMFTLSWTISWSSGSSWLEESSWLLAFSCIFCRFGKVVFTVWPRDGPTLSYIECLSTLIIFYILLVT